MRRLFPVLSITAAAVLLAFALAPACSDQCSRQDECATSEVCYAGICEPLTQENVPCNSNLDCNMMTGAECRAGRCTRVGPTPPPPPPPPDTGIPDDPDGGMNPGPDGGDATTGFPDAVGFPDASDAGTSTIADGGPPDTGMMMPAAERITGTLDTLMVAWTSNNATFQGTFVLAGNLTTIQGTGNMSSPIEGRRIEFNFPGGAPGTFTCAQPGVTIEWEDATGTVFAAGNGQGNCTLTVTAYGAPTEAILGNFSGTLQALVLGTPPPANETPVIMGDFDILRDMDIP
jgi:hypothetical protein